ncbi:hypothetical protein PIB30_036185 [Stylosanthes scabra]|uniref:FAF domain-containing protein n=1 Tax=Stylosanthes scabra TaxID=79078 RepID=A0ABU6RDE6_9FABA|nr:hypothetical protein [Stylosanthes scabra]
MASSFTTSMSRMSRKYYTSSNRDDDYIGSESCMDLQNDIVEIEVEKNMKQQPQLNTVKKMEKKRELPPPIRLLCGTTNDTTPSWALKRYHTSDGRLILKEEKVKRQEWFRAHRSNGRLILQLVPLSDDDDVEAEEQDDEVGESVLCLHCNNKNVMSSSSSSSPSSCVFMEHQHAYV